jgi:hypothetical protein
MPIIAKNTGGEFNNILPPQGNHTAICVRMIHIGTAEFEYKGEKKKQNRVRLYFELSYEKAIFKPEVGEENFMVSKEYTLSMHEKATLRKDLESWRGKAFTEEEAKAFDITALLGVPCMVNIITKVHEPTGNKYAQIASISGIPKGMEKPQRVNDLFEFSVDEFDEVKFRGFSEYLQERIKQTEEWQKYTKQISGEIETHSEEEHDDLPF